MERKKSSLLRVCLVMKDTQKGWILEKMTDRLAENLSTWNVEAFVAPYPSINADINHWMFYSDSIGEVVSRNTLGITHVDSKAKLHILRQRLAVMDLGICMSRMTVENLVANGIPREKLCYINPGHDGTIQPKRIVVGITSQLRSDGAKREDILLDVTKNMRLDLFHIQIIGPGWERIIPQLQSSGATVDYIPGAKDNRKHREIILARVPTFDYYLYLGFDEGSMGFLDALAAGIPTIVTPQGFHLDIEGGITHSFSDATELELIFRSLAGERERRIQSVRNLTWNEYARKHALVWEALICDSGAQIALELDGADAPPNSSCTSINTAGKRQKRIALTRFNKYRVVGDVKLLWESYTGRSFEQSFLFMILKRSYALWLAVYNFLLFKIFRQEKI